MLTFTGTIRKTLFIILILTCVLIDHPYAYKLYKAVSEFGSKGSSSGRFSDKVRLTFDKHGNIYLLDKSNLNVHKLNPNGGFITHIPTDSDFTFSKPQDIAVDNDLNIYVLDWKAVPVTSEQLKGEAIWGNFNPMQVFSYSPCIHKFDRNGKFIQTFIFEKITVEKVERVVPAIDTEGNFALMIAPKELERPMYMTTDKDNNIYVLDEKQLYKLDHSGNVVAHLTPLNSQLSNIGRATGLDVDSKGNVYIADSGNSRVMKFNSEGILVASFGRKGESNGCFVGDVYIRLTRDDKILVSDSAKYEKVLKTSVKSRKLLDSTVLITGQDDHLMPQTKRFETIIRRIQKFDEEGRYLDKSLYLLDMSDPDSRSIEFCALDEDGNLYLINKERVVIKKYREDKPFQTSNLNKVISFRILHNESRFQLDNFYDLNTYFDFDERSKYTGINISSTLSYNVTESFSVILSASVFQSNGSVIDKYPGEYGEPRGFIQDDISSDRYISARVRLDARLIMDHDPFKYRFGDLFVYLGGGRYRYNVDATDINNKRFLKERSWWAVWSTGMSYDVGESWRISMIVAQHFPMDYVAYEYVYWDELGELYNTGSGNGASTKVLISLSGTF